MAKSTRYLGLDVHAEPIVAAIAEGRSKVRSLGEVRNRPEALRPDGAGARCGDRAASPAHGSG